MTNKNESGRTMLEMLGVLAIMGVIMYGAIAGINFGLEMYKINATYNEIEELSRGIIDLYSWNRSYHGLGNGIICENDIMPSDACMASGSIVSKWHQNITVQKHSTDDTRFQIIYSGIKMLPCGRLVGMSYSHGELKADHKPCQAEGNTLTFTSY